MAAAATSAAPEGLPDEVPERIPLVSGSKFWCSTRAFGLGAMLASKFHWCPGCPGPELADIPAGSWVFNSCWCCCTRWCFCWCDEGMLVEAVTQRMPHPAPYVCLQPGTLKTLAQYDVMARGLVSSEVNSPHVLPYPEYDGAGERTVDGSGNNERYPWLGQGGRPYGQVTFRESSPDNVLPDANAFVRDIARRDTFKAAPNDVNSLVRDSDCWCYLCWKEKSHDTHRALPCCTNGGSG